MHNEVDEDATSEAVAEGRAGLSRRARATWLGAALLLLGSLVVGIVAFADGEGSALDGLEAADGVLTEASDDHLRLRPPETIDEGDELHLVIRPSDREALDIEHLRYHAREGLPVRVYYERDGDDHVARHTVDLPTLP